jgi:hypothetical protein
MMMLMMIASPPEHPLKLTIVVPTGVFAAPASARGLVAEEAVVAAAWQALTSEEVKPEDSVPDCSIGASRREAWKRVPCFP